MATEIQNKSADIISLFFGVGRLIRGECTKSDPYIFIKLEVLRFVADNKRPTMTELGEYLSVKAPTATAFINGLARAGLIERETDQRDRRIVHLKITSAGLNKLKHGREEMLKALKPHFAKLTKDELENLKKLLTKILDK